jgi:TonB family protein
MKPRRTRLEPVGHFAILVTAVHAVIGLGIWWWLHSRSTTPQESPGKNIAWMSPSDFTATAETPKPTEPPVTQPTPTKAPEPKDDDDNLPKAIAIDPAKAAEIMAKAIASAPTTPTKVEPAPTPPPAPAPVVADRPVEPAPPAAASKPVENTVAPKSPPKPVTEDPPAATNVARTITVSHPPANAKPPEQPKVASLLELAALDAGGTGATGSKSGIRLDEVDRAIIDSFMRNWTPPNASKLPLDQRTAHMEVTVNREGRLVRFKLAKSSGSKDLDESVKEAGNRLDKIGAELPATYLHDLYEFQVNFHVE